MSGQHSREGMLFRIVEMAYAATDDDEMVRAVFTALREFMSFSSGVFMPVNDATLELKPGFCFDCNAADMGPYLAHYAPLDPFVRCQPGPVLLNETVRFSDVITPGDLAHSEFVDFMRQVPYQHALGTLTGFAQQAVAVFSVHRQRHEHDFAAEERAILDAIGPHLARAVILRRQLNDPALRAETGIVVFDGAGTALYLNSPARAFLVATPPPALLAALSVQGAGVIKLASQYFRLSQLSMTSASLLRRFAVEESVAGAVTEATAEYGALERWSPATRQPGATRIVVVQPFRQRLDLIRRLAQYGLSPRQSEVAVWALRGLTNSEIASAMCIAEQTVKDHFQDIYCRVGVRTRGALLAKVLGTSSALPTGLGEKHS